LSPPAAGKYVCNVKGLRKNDLGDTSFWIRFNFKGKNFDMALQGRILYVTNVKVVISQIVYAKVIWAK